MAANSPVAPAAARPVGRRCGLLLELTYRCPRCIALFVTTRPILRTPALSSIPRDWIRVLQRRRARYGAVQLEAYPAVSRLSRDDLEEIVAEARGLGFYTNLITSGVGLTEVRIRALKNAGLDHIQLSFQDSSRQMNDFLSSTRTFDLKSKVAALIKQYEFRTMRCSTWCCIGSTSITSRRSLKWRCGSALNMSNWRIPSTMDGHFTIANSCCLAARAKWKRAERADHATLP